MASGDLALVLHAHLPYVRSGEPGSLEEDWYFQALQECYLPLVEVLEAHTVTVPDGPAAAVADSGRNVFIGQAAPFEYLRLLDKYLRIQWGLPSRHLPTSAVHLTRGDAAASCRHTLVVPLGAALAAAACGWRALKQ